MKVEKTRKLYKKRRHNKEIKRAKQLWNQQDPSSVIDSQESSDDDFEEIKTPQDSKSVVVPSDVIQFFNNPETLLEFKQFQEYLKIKDTIRNRSNSETNDISFSNKTSDKIPVTPPTTPTITKSTPLSSTELDLLESITEEEEDLSDFIEEKVIEKKNPQRNNASF